MTENLLIIFVKNFELGKVKTRLAQTIGSHESLEVYKQMVKLTEEASNKVDAHVHIYFSNHHSEDVWRGHFKKVQKGSNLGERMKNAFAEGFSKGYKKVVLIGSDLPDITSEIIEAGFSKLKESTVVLGPANDGGYYLIGLSEEHDFIFENKPWSQSNLFHETVLELDQNNVSYKTLDTLNDIDTFEDLVASKFYKNNTTLQEKLKAFHD